MSTNFVEFTNTIIRDSKLEITGGAGIKYIENYIVKGMGSKLWEFQEKSKALFEEWSKRAGSFLSIADFFIKNGGNLFKLWLSEVFPFNKKYLVIECKSHSAVDTQLSISYFFHQDEIKAIKNSLFMNDLKTTTEKDVAIFLLINSIKSISKYFTFLINKDYKISTNAVDSFQVEDDVISIDFKGTGRIT